MNARHVGFGLLAAVIGLGLFLAGRATVSRAPVQVIDRSDPAVAEPALAEPDAVSTNTLLTVWVGPDGSCLPAEPRSTWDDSLTLDSATHTFTLREPGNGSDYGPLIATSNGTGTDGCYVNASFLVPDGVRFFEVVDESMANRWGPFDVVQVESSDRILTLTN